MIIFGFLPKSLETRAVAVAFIMAWQQAAVKDWGEAAPDILAKISELVITDKPVLPGKCMPIEPISP